MQMGDKTRCCSGCRRGCWGQLNGGVSAATTSVNARYQVQASIDSAQTGANSCRMAEPSRRGSSSDLSSASSRAPGRGAEIASSSWLRLSSIVLLPSAQISTRRQRWTPPEPEQPIRLARDGISAKILSVPLGRTQPRGWAPARGLVIAE